MFAELMTLRNENFNTPNDFKLVRPEFQDGFNVVFKKMLYDTRPIVIPQDDDCDGWVCATLFREVIQHLNPNKHVEVYIPDMKRHGVDEDFLAYVDSKYPEGCHTIVTDSSSDCVETLAELFKKGYVIHIDHHLSFNEDTLNVVTHYHANCRYDSRYTLNALSAGFFSYLHLACYCLENTAVKPEFLEELFTLGTLSIVSDVCDLTDPYNRSIIKQYMRTQHQHVVLQCFSDKYTRYTLYFLAFKVAPKINMLFRLRYMEYLRKLHTTTHTQALIDAINGIYTNYRSVIESSLNYLEILDFGRFISVDITHLKVIYPMLEDNLSNFTGWYANKLSQTYIKPCIALCDTELGNCKGSSRDMTEQNTYSILEDISFIDGGGHPNAYGFTMNKDYIQELYSNFYYGLETEVLDKPVEALPISNLYELDMLGKTGDLCRFSEYNDYTINDKLGLMYTVKYSDVIENFPNRSLIKNSGYKIICFDSALKAGDTVKLIPDTQKNGIQLIANIVQRG